MSLLKELKEQVKAAIKPWSGSSDKPPFSPVELITMAMIICNGEPVSEQSILYSVSLHFKYYRNVGYRYHGEQPFGDKQLVLSRENHLHMGFYALELPASRVDLPREPFDECWQVSLPAARLFIQRAYGLEPIGAFPFLQLPPELRNVIYEMVLRFPAGIAIPSRDYNSFSGSPEYHTITNDVSQRPSIDSRTTYTCLYRPGAYAQTAQQALSLLLVNKQIFEEASSCFYKVNVFSFADGSDLYQFLRSMPSSRRQHIRQIMFKYSGPVAVGTVRYLNSMPNLRKLYIDVVPERWGGGLEPIDMDKHPGIGMLRKLRGLDEVTFSSRTPMIFQDLKAEMESPDIRKRKRLKVEAAARQQYPRKAKSKKLQQP